MDRTTSNPVRHDVPLNLETRLIASFTSGRSANPSRTAACRPAKAIEMAAVNHMHTHTHKRTRTHTHERTRTYTHAGNASRMVATTAYLNVLLRVGEGELEVARAPLATGHLPLDHHPEFLNRHHPVRCLGTSLGVHRLDARYPDGKGCVYRPWLSPCVCRRDPTSNEPVISSTDQ